MLKVDTHLLLIVIIGVGGGFFSGVAGLGGGAVLIPLMASWLSISQHQTQANSLLVIVITAATASAIYAASTNVDVLVVATIAIPRIVFSECWGPTLLKKLIPIF